MAPTATPVRTRLHGEFHRRDRERAGLVRVRGHQAPRQHERAETRECDDRGNRTDEDALSGQRHRASSELWDWRHSKANAAPSSSREARRRGAAPPRVFLLSLSVCPLTSPSSRGLGRGPFKAETRVRIPVGTPAFASRTAAGEASAGAPAKADRHSSRSERRRAGQRPKNSELGWQGKRRDPSGVAGSATRPATTAQLAADAVTECWSSCCDAVRHGCLPLLRLLAEK